MPTRQELRFTKLSVENWRNFRQIEVDLQRRVFLIGPNASGKSSLLDAFRFLRDIVSVGGGFQEAVSKRGGVSALYSLAADGCSDLVVGVDVGTDDDPSLWQYEIRFAQGPRQEPLLKQERVARQGSLLVRRPDEQDRQDPERLTQTSLEQVNANRAFRDLADFFASVQAYDLVPERIREADRRSTRISGRAQDDLIEQMARTPAQTRRARLRRILEALRMAVPQLEDLAFENDRRGVPHLRARYSHWRAPEAWQTEERFSDGTLRLIGLLWILLDGAGPLLLEEPEVFLHPGIVRWFPQMFARAQGRSRRQILVSTHSSDLLRDEGIGLDEVLLLIPGDEGTRIYRAGDFGEIRSLVGGGANLSEVVFPPKSGSLPHSVGA